MLKVLILSATNPVLVKTKTVKLKIKFLQQKNCNIFHNFFAVSSSHKNMWGVESIKEKTRTQCLKDYGLVRYRPRFSQVA